jgi:hypothetical protein
MIQHINLISMLLKSLKISLKKKKKKSDVIISRRITDEEDI